MTVLIIHTVFAVSVLIGYVVLTALGHDATDLLALLAGQGAGAAITSSAPKP